MPSGIVIVQTSFYYIVFQHNLVNRTDNICDESGFKNRLKNCILKLREVALD